MTNQDRPSALPDTQASALPPVLEMRGISKDFAGGQVLHDVDFSLRKGEVHALVGQNGAGKSTLMKILGGVYADFGGAISIDGRFVVLHDPRAALRTGVAIIYQDFTLVPHMTVAENIALGREPTGDLRGFIDHGRLRRDAEAEATALGLELPMDVPVSRLGVAAQQLTEIVKAISHHARILVMDEPTARLSGRERDRLFAIIRDLAAAGVSVIYISHFLEEIFEVADRVTVLRDGRVVASQPTRELDLAALTRLVVGDKYREVAQHRESTARPGEVALRLEGFGVSGRVAPMTVEVARGEVLGLAGLVGSGRTSLARAMVGLTRATGTLRIDGWSGRPSDPAEAAAIGLLVLAEDRKREGLVLQLSVAENVALTALRARLVRRGFVLLRKRMDVVRGLIRRLEIVPPLPGVSAGRLSGGNQQKVVFARAMAAGARVLVLDQPTAGVDVGAKSDLYAQIDDLAREGVAIVLISDDLDEVLHLSDRIVVMRRGIPEPPVPAISLDRADLLRAISETVGTYHPASRPQPA
jgi:ABC-type sugar transport system ATPase subunit